MEFKINIEKVHILIILFVLVAVGFVVAQQTLPTPNPGHNSGDILVTGIPGGVDQSLNSFLLWLNDQVNILDGRVDGQDISIGFLQNKVNNCPSGMNRVGDFCIETTRRSPANWPTAVVTCASSAKHLCSGAEWVAACFSGRSSSWGGTWGGPNGEWAGDVITGVSASVDAAAVYGYGPNCDNTHVAYRIDNVNPPFRCCKNMI